MKPISGYAELGEQRIAYQVIGDGPIDVVFTMGFVGSVDVEWEEPMVRLFFQQVARYARLIRFDRRGAGASDPVALDALPPWESFADEIDAVMDGVGSDEAALIAAGQAGPVGVYFAATRPEKVTALVLAQTSVRYLKTDDYAVGWTPEELAESRIKFAGKWGSGEAFDLLVPSKSGDERLRAWYAKLERSITSPRALQKYQEGDQNVDARALLPSVTVPTLVIHRRDNNFVPLAWGKYIADNIPGAQFVEIPGRDALPYFEYPERTLAAIEKFLTGVERQPAPDRQLSTVLFTDIVDSTANAERLGDRRWREVIDFHDNLSAELLTAHLGHLVKTTGDGVVATFDGPGRAIRAAFALQDELDKVDLKIRSGIHTGEIEVRNNDVGGIAVHLAARIMAKAGPDEVMVSSTVKDLVIGSEINFEDRGSFSFKGVEGEWNLYSVKST